MVFKRYINNGHVFVLILAFLLAVKHLNYNLTQCINRNIVRQTYMLKIAIIFHVRKRIHKTLALQFARPLNARFKRQYVVYPLPSISAI